MLFEDKVVLVTGSSSGIGATIAIKFAEEGAHVVLVARNEAKLKYVATKCEIRGKNPLIVVADVTEDSNVKQIVDKTITKLGKIDILVNNVGTAGSVSIFSKNAVTVYDEMIKTNLRSAVSMTNIVIPYIIQAQGNIINIGSIGASASILTENFAYCTSKAGLEQFTKCIALELASKGVRVNIVSPGPVKTDFIDRMGLDEEAQREVVSALSRGTALGKISESDEVADVVLFLASDRAKSITGSSFVIDNGCLLKGLMKMTE